MRALSRRLGLSRKRPPLGFIHGPSSRALTGAILGALPGFILPFAVVAKVGVGQLTDAYSYAIAVATIASTFVAGVLQPNVLPVLQQAKSHGEAHFVHKLRRLVAQSVPVVTVAYAAVSAGVVLYIRHEPHWANQRHFMLISLAVLWVYVVCSAINAMTAAALNALGRFFAPAANQALRSLAPLAALPVVASSQRGLIVITCLLSASELARGAVLAWQVRRAAGELQPTRGEVRAGGDRSFWVIASPAAVSLAIVSLSPLIDRGVAATLPAGSTTLISLGETIFQVPFTMIAASIVLVAGTYWATLGRTDSRTLAVDVRRTIVRGSLVSIGLTIASLIVIAGGALLAGPQFAGAPTWRLVVVVTYLLVGLPAAFVTSVGSRFVTSTQTTYLLPSLAVIAFSLNLGFDIVGANLLGVAGIALSSTIFRCVNALLYIAVMRRLLRRNLTGLGVRQLLAVPYVSLLRRVRILDKRLGANARRSLGRRPGQPSFIGLMVLLGTGVGIALVAVTAKSAGTAEAATGLSLLVAASAVLPVDSLPPFALALTLLLPTSAAVLPAAAQNTPLGVVPFVIWLIRAPGQRFAVRMQTAFCVLLGVWLCFSEILAPFHSRRGVEWLVMALPCLVVGPILGKSLDAERLRKVFLRIVTPVACYGLLEGFVWHRNVLFGFLFRSASWYSSVESGTNYRITTIFGHPLINGTIFAAAGVLAASDLMVVSARTPTRIVRLLVIFGAVLATYSRGPAVALCVGIIVLVVFARPQTERAKARRAFLTCVLVVAGLAFAAGLSARNSSTIGQSSASTRLTVIDDGLRAVSGLEPFGAGPGQAEEYRTQNDLPGTGGVTGQFALENGYVELLVALGPVGLFLVIGVLVTPIANALRRGLAVAEAAALTAVLVELAGFNSVEGFTPLMVLVALLSATLWQSPDELRARAVSAGSRHMPNRSARKAGPHLAAVDWQAARGGRRDSG